MRQSWKDVWSNSPVYSNVQGFVSSPDAFYHAKSDKIMKVFEHIEMKIIVMQCYRKHFRAVIKYIYQTANHVDSSGFKGKIILQINIYTWKWKNLMAWINLERAQSISNKIYLNIDRIKKIKIMYSNSNITINETFLMLVQESCQCLKFAQEKFVSLLAGPGVWRPTFDIFSFLFGQRL